MLQILITNILLISINFGAGNLISKLLKIRIRRVSVMALFGMTVITCLQTCIAFFVPLNLVVESCIAVPGLFGLLMFIKSKNWKILAVLKYLNFWFFFFLIVILSVAAYTPYFYDHYSYYLPTISYLKAFGFIKGVASVDLLLGQTSFWHIYQAGFSNFIDTNLKINSFVLILFLIYVYESRRTALLLFFPFLLILLPQPSPDLPALILALIVVNEVIGGRNNILMLVLALFAFCIKPVVFWLPLLVILESLYTRAFQYRFLIPVIVFGFLFSLKNLLLFGFPLFPVSIIDFNFPWKPSTELLTYSSQIGLMKSYDMQYGYQEILTFNQWEKIGHWFTAGSKSIFNVLVVLCLLILGWLSFRKQDKIYALVFLCFLLKFILIVSFSAQYRFFLDLYAITIFLLFKNLEEQKTIVVATMMSIFVLVIFSCPDFVKNRFSMGKWMTGFHMSQLIKPDHLESVKLLNDEKIGNFSFFVPRDPLAKDRFPSLSIYDLRLYQYYSVFPQRSENGFVQRPLTKDEKWKLKQIIDGLEKSEK